MRIQVLVQVECGACMRETLNTTADIALDTSSYFDETKTEITITPDLTKGWTRVGNEAVCPKCSPK